MMLLFLFITMSLWCTERNETEPFGRPIAIFNHDNIGERSFSYRVGAKGDSQSLSLEEHKTSAILGWAGRRLVCDLPYTGDAVLTVRGQGFSEQYFKGLEKMMCSSQPEDQSRAYFLAKNYSPQTIEASVKFSHEGGSGYALIIKPPKSDAYTARFFLMEKSGPPKTFGGYEEKSEGLSLTRVLREDVRGQQVFLEIYVAYKDLSQAVLRWGLRTPCVDEQGYKTFSVEEMDRKIWQFDVQDETDQPCGEGGL